MNIIEGKKVRESLKKELEEKINNIESKLKLVVFEVGDNPASRIYVKNKQKLCEEMNIEFDLRKYDDISETELINEIENCNSDKSVTGILVQLPLPSNINEKNVIEAIDYRKDVDGLTSKNVGKLSLGEKCLTACTALGIIKMLEYENIDPKGKNVVIIGRSKLVGLPLAQLFLKKDATVTICHSKTENLKEITKTADILVVAIGKKQYINNEYIKDGATVIDVGINRDDKKIYGDCDFESIKDKAEYITPVPGGVGVMTVTMLINNLIEAYYLQN